ncbi:hypothetical protein M2323_001523 [Rhodoblastus acidophilus]|uniref:hypothetical protein n=1 Tax=Rhodoblastus acidophilus TaxID=1074 RepID=UPI002224D1F8|nr:hypothetical protein [Rhodoblastus acidophilus]MCW2283914.1 hypothetical protein [Rhodoblastus acidophilus]MCW2332610.1 hypothetical protein [Rhodoblastus acidophilus]
MNTTTLASFRFPHRLAATSKEDFAPQDIVDVLKIDPAYFHQSFRRKFKPKPAEPDSGDFFGGPARALDVTSKTRDARDLLETMAALADFHKLVVREDVDRFEAIEPDFPRWREFPGAFVLWTARIIDQETARLRVVRQLVSNESAVAAVAQALALSPRVSVEGGDMIVAYVAERTHRPALAGEG